MDTVLIATIKSPAFLKDNPEIGVPNERSSTLANEIETLTVNAHNDQPLAVDSAGDGPAVLLVHGLGFSRKQWRSHLAVLAESGLRAISVDLRGFGDSELPNEQYLMDDLAHDLEGLRQQLNVNDFAVVNHSMGGMVTQRYVINYPNAVRSLLLASTSSHSGRRAVAFAKAMSLLSEHGFEAAAAQPDVWHEIESAVSSAFPWNDAMRNVLKRLTARPKAAHALGWNAVSRFSAKDRLHEVECPTVVMHGNKDILIPIGLGRLTHQAIAHSQWKENDGGHNFPIEEQQEFMATLLEFLKLV